MITGFNNDVKYGDTVFHVQTEDKGVSSAWIESLIYVGGRILARKRVTYRQILDEGGEAKQIAKLMERQHRLMIQQIRGGRFAEDGTEVKPETEKAASEEGGGSVKRIQAQAKAIFETAEREQIKEVAGSPPPLPPAPNETAAEAARSESSSEGQEGPAPTLDQVIFDYLSTVASEETLVLLMDESPALASATTTVMDLGAHASRSGKPVGGAGIAVRMISKTGAPVTLAEGTTAVDGTLQLVVEVPEVEPDTAALIITASSSIGGAEIKHLL